MDLRKRLVVLTLAALLLAVVGATAGTRWSLQQQSQQEAQLDEQNRLVGTSNIAYNALQNELARIQVAAKYLAVNPDILAALQHRTPGTVQDNVLEPYRRASNLSFVSLITATSKRQIAQAKSLTPPQIPYIAIVGDSLRLQQDRMGIWDGPGKPAGAPYPQAPYAVAVSPVLDGNTLVGAVVVGRALDTSFVNQLTANLGGFQAAIVNGDAMLAIPGNLDQAFAAARASRPYQPQVLPVQRSVPLPNGNWQAAGWNIGTGHYVAMIRPLGFGSKDQLAVALATTASPGGPQRVLPPLASWLADRLGIPVASAYGIVIDGLWWLSLLLLLLAVGGLAIFGVHLALRPIRRLEACTAAFRRSRSWPEMTPSAHGELGRLSGAVAGLAHEAAGWYHELTVYRERLQAVLDSMHTGVVVSDNDGHIELINPAARELLGIDTGAAALPVPVTPPSGTGQSFQATNGRAINAIATPIRREDGETMGLVTVLEDMTRERELERVRSDFLTVVSHELRTPLTAVKGSLDLLLDGDAGALEPLQQRFLQTARRNTERLIGLVNDLLDMSRLEAGQVHLTLQPADMRRIVDDAVIGLGTIFDRKRQAVHLTLPPQPLLVLADRRRFEQVVTNLLGNAASYTPEEGQISILARPDSATGQAVLTVRNSGPGITPEDREHLFEKFYRGGNALTRQDGGSGLGLAIVKSLVDLHHGTISVESEPGHGAAFSVRLPLAGEGRENTAGR